MAHATRWKIGLGIAAVAGSLVAAGCSSSPSGAGSGTGASNDSSAGGTLTIAASNPMTGDDGYFGQQKVKAIKLAIQQVNSAGGIKGRKVQLIVDDDQGNPQQGASLATKECGNSSILAVLGHWNSSVSLATAPIYDKCGLPNINADTTDKLSGISPYEFRIFATGRIEGGVLAEYAKLKGYKRIAVLYDTSDYGISMQNGFENKFKALGGTVTLSDSYIAGTQNFAPEATKVVASRPDAVFIGGYYVETALISKAVRAAGLQVPIIGADGADSPQLVSLGGPAVQGLVLADDYSFDLPGAENTAFVKLWRQHYGGTPGTFAALAYDAANLVFDGFKHGATTRESLDKYLEGVHGFVGVTGPITFNSKHDATRPVFLRVVKGNAISLNPEQVVNGKLVPAADLFKK